VPANHYSTPNAPNLPMNESSIIQLSYNVTDWQFVIVSINKTVTLTSLSPNVMSGIHDNSRVVFSRPLRTFPSLKYCSGSVGAQDYLVAPCRVAFVSHLNRTGVAARGYRSFFDSVCQESAEQIGTNYVRALSSSFKAFVDFGNAITASDYNSLAEQQCLQLPSGAMVVAYVGDLLDDDLQYPINELADATPLLDVTREVWTGTAVEGALLDPRTCAGWTSAGMYGSTGVINVSCVCAIDAMFSE
jgi:hypothetical protein